MNMTKADVREAIKDLVLRDANGITVFKDDEGIEDENGVFSEDVFVKGLEKNFPYVKITRRADEPEITDVMYSDTKCKFTAFNCEPGRYSVNLKLMRFSEWFKWGYNNSEKIDTIIMIPDIRVRLEIAPYDEMECLVMILSEGKLVDVVSNISIEKKFIEVITKI